MRFIFTFILLIFLTSCASGTWSHRSGINESQSIDTGYCNALARSQYPGYICRNPLMCAPDETNKVLDQLIGKDAVVKKCMYQKGYDYK